MSVDAEKNKLILIVKLDELKNLLENKASLTEIEVKEFKKELADIEKLIHSELDLKISKKELDLAKKFYSIFK